MQEVEFSILRSAIASTSHLKIRKNRNQPTKGRKNRSQKSSDHLKKNEEDFVELTGIFPKMYTQHELLVTLHTSRVLRVQFFIMAFFGMDMANGT